MKINSLTAAERVELARDPMRPTTRDYIANIFEDFIELAGDRCFGNDESITGGIGTFHGRPVTVIGHQKGRTLEENMRYRFGMPDPEGYRKARRLMEQAGKFGRPVITFVDTPGAYPGMEAEERGQAEAIARCIETMSMLRVPTIAVFIGEGGSGGALALAVSDRTIMLENSIFSILSPEGFASILWKDPALWKDACQVMKLTAEDIRELGICDSVIPEAAGGAHMAPDYVFEAVDAAIGRHLDQMLKLAPSEIVKKRYRKLRNVGNLHGRN